MAKREDKTNVMRTLELRSINYVSHFYEADATLSGKQIAALLGEPEDQVFKTLVTQGKPGKHYVFIIPVNSELNLKKAAAAVGEKSVQMIPQKELLPLTGYVHGGCSPVGMRKVFPTYLDASAEGKEHIFISGGKVGCQVELDPADLSKAVSYTFTELTDES